MHVPQTAAPRAAGARALRLVLLVAAAALGAGAVARVASALAGVVSVYRVEPAPPPPSLDALRSLTNGTPIVVTTTAASWRKVHVATTADRVLHDRSLWRQMHFEDWDHVPRHLREPALDLMVRVHAQVLRPATWRSMTARDWDGVPQPVRAIAYARMIAYWAAREQVGLQFGLEPRHMAQTIAAIVMAESWFEHRAVNTNEWGNRDLGLAQCSDYCREEMTAMAARGDIGFAPEGADYLDPLVGTRVATVWFARELQRAAGDVDLAIRAYHRGIDNAYDEQGDAYLDRVLAKRRRYIRNVDAPPSWTYVVERASQFAARGAAGDSRGPGHS